jgi:hypothetical protein
MSGVLLLCLYLPGTKKVGLGDVELVLIHGQVVVCYHKGGGG